ncbi:MAG TPA: WG repeat-containing protein, partial [Firmicutes bacterium]|nr:WG repeat-containing protein [Bacillota bacterium]
GFIDKTGQYVINPQFDFAFDFSEGLAPVKIAEKWGFIDKTGQFVINPQFDGIDLLSILSP